MTGLALLHELPDLRLPGQRTSVQRWRGRPHLWIRAAAILVACWLPLDLCMAQLAGERIAADLREEVHRIEVTVQDMYGRQETASIAHASELAVK